MAVQMAAQRGALDPELLQATADIERLVCTWRCRQVVCKVTSCCCAPCTTCVICIPSLLGFYYICYRILNGHADPVEQALNWCQCALFQQYPENCCQLACTCCTPLAIADMQDDLYFYSLPPERQSMEEAMLTIDRISREQILG